MHRTLKACCLLAVMKALVGCLVETAGEDSWGNAENAISTANALIPNALIPNALIPNAMAPEVLALGALSLGALAPDALDALHDPGTRGNLSRLFIKYVVGCAFESTQSLSFTWTDSAGVPHAESYTGSLGIEPTWATQPLSRETSQRLITGCLAGRTNYFGIPVFLSMRSTMDFKLLPKAAEVAAYPYVEGAFWGNLFTDHPSVFACANPENIDHSRAHQRQCATGYLDPKGQLFACGPIQLQGSCQELCGSPNATGTYVACQDSSGSMSRGVITTALP